MAIRTGELLALTRIGYGCCPTENDEPKCPQLGEQEIVQGRRYTTPGLEATFAPIPI